MTGRELVANANHATRLPKVLRRREGRLPKLHEIPIPADVRPGPGWTGQMREMADHVGAYLTLCLVAAHGGEQVHVPRDPAASPFRDTLPPDVCAKIAWVHGGSGNRLDLPVAQAAVNRARRAIVLAAVRECLLTGADAAKIIGTSRTYLAYLINQTNEGEKGEEKHDKPKQMKQLDLFPNNPKQRRMTPA